MDLSPYSLPDIDAACKTLGQQKRSEGETAFPDLATILDAVRGAVRASRPSAENESQRKWDAQVEHFKQNPEMYMTPEEVKEMFSEALKKVSL